MRAVGIGLAALLMAAAAGCGGGAEDDGPEDSTSTSATSLAERCATGIPSDAGVSPIVLSDDAGISLSAAQFDGADGPSGTVLVLLHQTGPFGLCGWGRFATAAAAQGLPSVAIDMCSYGDSACPDGMDTPPEVQVDLAVTHARDAMGARRVVLVGASMGGSETVIAVAQGAQVDAWVDLSGPSTWAGVRLLDLADALTDTGLPGMVAHATDDDRLQYAAARRLARAAGARFLDGASGHGYELLTDVLGSLRPDGQTVIAFALGGR